METYELFGSPPASLPRRRPCPKPKPKPTPPSSPPPVVLSVRNGIINRDWGSQGSSQRSTTTSSTQRENGRSNGLSGRKESGVSHFKGKGRQSAVAVAVEVDDSEDDPLILAAGKDLALFQSRPVPVPASRVKTASPAISAVSRRRMEELERTREKEKQRLKRRGKQHPADEVLVEGSSDADGDQPLASGSGSRSHVIAKKPFAKQRAADGHGAKTKDQLVPLAASHGRPQAEAFISKHGVDPRPAHLPKITSSRLSEMDALIADQEKNRLLMERLTSAASNTHGKVHCPLLDDPDSVHRSEAPSSLSKRPTPSPPPARQSADRSSPAESDCSTPIQRSKKKGTGTSVFDELLLEKERNDRLMQSLGGYLSKNGHGHAQGPKAKAKARLDAGAEASDSDEENDDFEILPSISHKAPHPDSDDERDASNAPDDEDETYLAGYRDEEDLCPYCHEALPSRPSVFLQDLRHRIRFSRRDNRKHLPDSLTTTSWMSATEFCHAHRAESTVIPLGIRSNYPDEIDFQKIYVRLENGWIRKRLDQVIKKPERSGIFRRQVVEIGSMGKRAWTGTFSGMGEIGGNAQDAALPGCFGPLGSDILKWYFSNLLDWNLLPSLQSDPPSCNPLTAREFISRVLIPEASVLLIMSDKGWSPAPAPAAGIAGDSFGDAHARASAIRTASVEYGKVKFRAEGREAEDVRAAWIAGTEVRKRWIAESRARPRKIKEDHERKRTGKKKRRVGEPKEVFVVSDESDIDARRKMGVELVDLEPESDAGPGPGPPSSQATITNCGMHASDFLDGLDGVDLNELFESQPLSSAGDLEMDPGVSTSQTARKTHIHLSPDRSLASLDANTPLPAPGSPFDMHRKKVGRNIGKRSQTTVSAGDYEYDMIEFDEAELRRLEQLENRKDRSSQPVSRS